MGEVKMMTKMVGMECSRPNDLRWNRKDPRSAIGFAAPEWEWAETAAQQAGAVIVIVPALRIAP
jgi:hypothetical protein